MAKRGPKPLTRWSKSFDCCQICGRTRFPNKSRGTCSSCWFAIWYGRHRTAHNLRRKQRRLFGESQ
jgi:hypothetical protein